MEWGETHPAIKLSYNNLKWLSKYLTLFWEVSATLIDVPLENAQNMHSVWTAWFQFWHKKKHNLRIDVLFLNSILNNVSSGFNWIIKKKH